MPNKYAVDCPGADHKSVNAMGSSSAYATHTETVEAAGYRITTDHYLEFYDHPQKDASVTYAPGAYNSVATMPPPEDDPDDRPVLVKDFKEFLKSQQLRDELRAWSASVNECAAAPVSIQIDGEEVARIVQGLVKARALR